MANMKDFEKTVFCVSFRDINTEALDKDLTIYITLLNCSADRGAHNMDVNPIWMS